MLTPAGQTLRQWRRGGGWRRPNDGDLTEELSADAAQSLLDLSTKPLHVPLHVIVTLRPELDLSLWVNLVRNSQGIRAAKLCPPRSAAARRDPSGACGLRHQGHANFLDGLRHDRLRHLQAAQADPTLPNQESPSAVGKHLVFKTL